MRAKGRIRCSLLHGLGLAGCPLGILSGDFFIIALLLVRSCGYFVISTLLFVGRFLGNPVCASYDCIYDVLQLCKAFPNARMPRSADRCPAILLGNWSQIDGDIRVEEHCRNVWELFARSVDGMLSQSCQGIM